MTGRKGGRVGKGLEGSRREPGGEALQGGSTARDPAGRRDAEKKKDDGAAEDLGDNDWARRSSSEEAAEAVLQEPCRECGGDGPRRRPAQAKRRARLTTSPSEDD